MSRRPDDAGRRGQLIRESARLFREKGYEATSVRDIAAATGLQSGSWVYHFKTKHDLAAALIERYADQDEHHFNDAMAKAEQLARDPLQQLLIFLGLFIEMTEQLEEPFPGCLYASYCYQSGAISEQTMAQVERMMHFWRRRLAAKIEGVTALYPPRIPVENHQVADHVLASFEGAFILSKLMKEAKLASEQLVQCRNYIELLFSP